MPQFKEEAASGRFFFRKQNRILKRGDFQKVYSQAKPWRRPLLHVFILPPAPIDSPAPPASDAVPQEPAPTRLGITATKKVGKAVHRNRGRRLVRESFRHALPDLKPGYSIVVNVMRGATTAPYTKVDAQLRDILQQAGVFKEATNDKAEREMDIPVRQLPG